MTVAARTAGIVDPTIGSALVELGYDRDFAAIADHRRVTDVPPEPAPGWWRIGLDPTTGPSPSRRRPRRRRCRRPRRLPPTGPPPASPTTLGCGVLVNLGGDVAVAGPAPAGGWAVGHRRPCTTAPDADEVVALRSGGLATSGTTARTWSHGGARSTTSSTRGPGSPAAPAGRWCRRSPPPASRPTPGPRPPWCGARTPPGNLAEHGVTARLVDADGRVVHVGGWPSATVTPGVGPGGLGRQRPQGALMLTSSSDRSLWYTIRATGIVALVLLTSPRSSACCPPAGSEPGLAGVRPGRPAQAGHHVGPGVPGIHVVTAVLDTYVHVGLASIVVPFTSSYKPLWTGLGAVAVDLMVAVAISSALRQRIAPHLAGHPLAGLRLLAVGHGPRPRRGHRCRQAVDGCPRRPCTLAVGASLAWRIGDHRSEPRAGHPGRRHHPGGAHPDGHPARPGQVRHRGPPDTDRVTERGRPLDEGSPMTTMTLESTTPAHRARRGPGPGLADHLALHGPLSIPPGNDPAWREGDASGMAASGLAGRGGGGFPAADKWGSLRRAGRRPVVVVNAMEGEPASAKDRRSWPGRPTWSWTAPSWWPPCSAPPGRGLRGRRRTTRPGRCDRTAVAERRRSRPARVRVTLQRPPGRYVTGEESALVSWLDRGDARPVLRVDKSVPLAVGRRPVLVHNAETLAQVALIARHGPAGSVGWAPPDAPGTDPGDRDRMPCAPRAWSRSELGTPVDEIVRAVRADGADVGRPGRRVRRRLARPRPAGHPLAPAPLARAGATSGSGIVVALPTTSCGIAETARIARWMAGESAGQCGPCVFGLPAIADDLELLCRRPGRPRCAGPDRRAGPAGRRPRRLPPSRRRGPAGAQRPGGVRRRRRRPRRRPPVSPAPAARPVLIFPPTAAVGRCVMSTRRTVGGAPSGWTRWPVTPTASAPSCFPSG